MSNFYQHQQQLLHEIGIISWVERTQTTKPMVSSLWRDGIDGAYLSNSVSSTFIQSNTDNHIESPIIHATTSDNISPIVLVDELAQISIAEPVQEIIEPCFKINIHLELYGTADLLLVANLSDTQEVHHQLWKNIQQSIKKYMMDIEHLYVQWNYPWLDDVVSNSVADSYLKGVLDYYTYDKIVFVLGDLPFYQTDLKASYDYTYFASLIELEQSTELKRQLWQAIQKNIANKIKI